MTRAHYTHHAHPVGLQNLHDMRTRKCVCLRPRAGMSEEPLGKCQRKSAQREFAASTIGAPGAIAPALHKCVTTHVNTAAARPNKFSALYGCLGDGGIQHAPCEHAPSTRTTASGATRVSPLTPGCSPQATRPCGLTSHLRRQARILSQDQRTHSQNQTAA